MERAMRLIDLLRQFHEEVQNGSTRDLTASELALIERCRRRVAVAESPAARTQIMVEEGITPDNLAQLDISDETREAMEWLLREGAQ